MKYGKYTSNGQSKSNDDKNESFNSVINVVADRIHLISHNGANAMSDLKVTDNKELMTYENINKFASEGQRMVYGDELIAFLEQFREILGTHTHHWCVDYMCRDPKYVNFWSKDLNELLCNTIRIA